MGVSTSAFLKEGDGNKSGRVLASSDIVSLDLYSVHTWYHTRYNTYISPLLAKGKGKRRGLWERGGGFDCMHVPARGVGLAPQCAVPTCVCARVHWFVLSFVRSISRSAGSTVLCDG